MQHEQHTNVSHPVLGPFHALYVNTICSSFSSSSSTISRRVPQYQSGPAQGSFLIKKEFFCCLFMGQPVGSMNCLDCNGNKVELNWNSYFSLLKPQKYHFPLSFFKVDYVRGSLCSVVQCLVTQPEEAASDYAAALFSSTGIYQPFPLKHVQHTANLIQLHASRLLLLSPSTQLKGANLNFKCFFIAALMTVLSKKWTKSDFSPPPKFTSFLLIYNKLRP